MRNLIILTCLTSIKDYLVWHSYKYYNLWRHMTDHLPCVCEERKKSEIAGQEISAADETRNLKKYIFKSKKFVKRFLCFCSKFPFAFIRITSCFNEMHILLKIIYFVCDEVIISLSPNRFAIVCKNNLTLYVENSFSRLK